MKDWQALTGELADRLAEKLSARALGWRGEEIAELARRSSAAMEFVDDLGRHSTSDAAEARCAWTVLDRTEGIPWPVLKALNDCQKPFHLWNVERTEMEYPFELRKEPKLSVGGAASEDVKGMPARIEKATRVLAKWISDREFEALVEKGNRRRFDQLLRDPLPFGKADPGGAAPTQTISWNPLTGGAPPPGMRLPGSSGGFSMGPPPPPPGGPRVR